MTIEPDLCLISGLDPNMKLLKVRICMKWMEFRRRACRARKIIPTTLPRRDPQHQHTRRRLVSFAKASLFYINPLCRLVLKNNLLRKYYGGYSGYLGPSLQRLAECLYNTGQPAEAAQAIQVGFKNKFTLKPVGSKNENCNGNKDDESL